MIENITLREYMVLDEKFEYDFILKYIMPKDVYNIGDFAELEFGLIKDLQFDISEGLSWVKLIEYIAKILKKKERVIGSYKLIDIAECKSYIIAEIERIGLIESELLGYIPTQKEKEAGIEEFNKFGSYGQLRSLANNDITKIDSVKKIKYSLCLLELYYQKVNNDYQKRYNEIK